MEIIENDPVFGNESADLLSHNIVKCETDDKKTIYAICCNFNANDLTPKDRTKLEEYVKEVAKNKESVNDVIENFKRDVENYK